MDPDLESFLQKTGWSCDELLKKLNTYKQNSASTSSEPKKEETPPKVEESSTKTAAETGSDDECCSTNSSGVFTYEHSECGKNCDKAEVAVKETETDQELNNDHLDKETDVNDTVVDEQVEPQVVNETEDVIHVPESDSESDKENKTEEEEEEEQEPLEPHAIEDIRNNLKLQLTSLRNRKMEHFIQPLTTKIVEPNGLELENKKLGKLKLVPEPEPPESTKEQDVVCITDDSNSNPDDVSVLEATNEFGCVIASVEGGVTDDSSQTVNDSPKKHEDFSVFAEIRRIIQKPKNRPSLSPKAKIISVIKKPQHTQPFSPTAGLKEHHKNNAQSPFVSNELEKFLTKDADLNISYAVPKSGAEEGLIAHCRSESPVWERQDTIGRKIKQEKEEKEEPHVPKIKAKTLAEKRKLLELQKWTETAAECQGVEEIRLEIVADEPELPKYKYRPYEKKKLRMAMLKAKEAARKKREEMVEETIHLKIISGGEPDIKVEEEEEVKKIEEKIRKRNLEEQNLRNLEEQNLSKKATDKKQIKLDGDKLEQGKNLRYNEVEIIELDKEDETSQPETGTESKKSENIQKVDNLQLPIKLEGIEEKKPVKKINEKLGEPRRVGRPPKKQEESSPKVPVQKDPPLANHLRLHKRKKLNIKTGFVLYNNKKISVCSTREELICKINDGTPLKSETTNKPPIESPKKPSLWYNKNQMKYKPGPLCKKSLLQMTDCDKYRSEVRKLPTPILEIMPEFGKPIDPKIEHLLPKNNGIITDFLLEFALTALDNGKKDLNIFGIKVPYKYKNQQVLVRIPNVPKVPKLELEDKKQTSDDRNNIANILDDLITYVELKEHSEDIYMIEPVERPVEDEGPVKVAPIADTISAIVPKPGRRRLNKVALELAKLNCKVVKIDIDHEQKYTCDKPYCTMGCVCNSLNCTSHHSAHCRKIKCMFQCTCPLKEIERYESDIVLSAGTDLLSKDTVHRIEETAKKDMAPVEKEFTQTVICTSDKAIVVGAGDRKVRRVTRAPKKYADFVDDEEAEQVRPKDQPKEQLKVPECTVSLDRLDLSTLVPFCWFHFKHDCPCIYTDTSRTNSPIQQENTCARFISANRYIARNRKNTYFNKLLKAIDAQISIPIIYDPIEFWTKEWPKPDVTDAEVLMRSNETSPTMGRKHKRKQSFTDVQLGDGDEVVEAKRRRSCPADVPTADEQNKRHSLPVINELTRTIKDKAIQRRSLKPKGKKRFKAVFQGEYFIDDNSAFFKHLGPAQNGYVRLLPWLALLEKFQANQINIWSQVGKSLVLMNTSDKQMPAGFVDIRYQTPKAEVCKWLLAGKLPPKYDPNNMSFILCENKKHYEIRGFFNRNNKETESEPEKPSVQAPVWKHRDKNEEMQCMNVTMTHYQPYTIRTMRSDHKSLEIRDVQLPKITKLDRWRVYVLRSDFAFLNFKKNNYSIRYTILKKGVEKAVASRSTLRLSDEKMSQGYTNRMFGIYFSPNCLKNFFVGPYGVNEPHELETLRYINQNLVDTECYNRINGGEASFSNAQWMYINLQTDLTTPSSALTSTSPSTSTSSSSSASSYSSRSSSSSSSASTGPSQKSSETIIDLTNDDDDDKSVKNVGATTALYLSPHQPVTGNPHVVMSKPRAPHEFNRFLVTNVPGLGYVGAMETEDGSFEASWPFESKMLRFASAHQAVQHFQRIYNERLITVPEEFRVKVHVALTAACINPVDPICLSGIYICGNFGVIDAKHITDDVLKKCGVSREYIQTLLQRRVQKVISWNLSCFIKKVNLFDGIDDPPTDTNTILEMAVLMILKLQEVNRMLEEEKKRQEDYNKVLKTRRQNLLDLLPSTEPIASGTQEIGKQATTPPKEKQVFKMVSILKPVKINKIPVNESDMEITKIVPHQHKVLNGMSIVQKNGEFRLMGPILKRKSVDETVVATKKLILND